MSSIFLQKNFSHLDPVHRQNVNEWFVVGQLFFPSWNSNSDLKFTKDRTIT